MSETIGEQVRRERETYEQRQLKTKRQIRWQDVTPDMFREGGELEKVEFFDCLDSERLTHRDAWEYLQAAFDAMHPDRPTGPFYVWCWVRQTVSDDWLKYQAECIVENFEECWGEEFGPWDDAPDTAADTGELLELLKRWRDKSEAYACDNADVVIVLDDEAIEEVGREIWGDDWK